MRKVNAARRPPRNSAGLRIRRPILLLSCSMTVAALAAGIWHGGYINAGLAQVEGRLGRELSDEGFVLHRMTLSGQERTPADAAYAAVATQPGDLMFAISPSAMRARLLQLPWVSDAEVRRTFPDQLSVHLIEKRPFALWRSGGSLWVVERSGAVITAADRSEFPHLPLLVGEGAADNAAAAVDEIGKETAVAARLEVLERIGDRRWDLHLTGGVVVRLPEEHWDTQLAELETLIVEKGVLERDVEVIDLRYPDNYVFKLRNGDSRPIPRERRA